MTDKHTIAEEERQNRRPRRSISDPELSASRFFESRLETKYKKQRDKEDHKKKSKKKSKHFHFHLRHHHRGKTRSGSEESSDERSNDEHPTRRNESHSHKEPSESHLSLKSFLQVPHRYKNHKDSKHGSRSPSPHHRDTKKSRSPSPHSPRDTKKSRSPSPHHKDSRHDSRSPSPHSPREQKSSSSLTTTSVLLSQQENISKQTTEQSTQKDAGSLSVDDTSNNYNKDNKETDISTQPKEKHFIEYEDSEGDVEIPPLIRKPTPVVPDTICFHCNKPVPEGEGKIIGRIRSHDECFACVKCNVSFEKEIYYSVDKKLYCAKCLPPDSNVHPEET